MRAIPQLNPEEIICHLKHLQQILMITAYNEVHPKLVRELTRKNCRRL